MDEIKESDFDWWAGFDRSDQYTLTVTEIGKKQILDNQKIVNKLKEKLLYYQNRGWDTEVEYCKILEEVYFVVKLEET